MKAYRCPVCKRIAETRCGFVKKHWFCNNLIFRWVRTMKPILIAAICVLWATSVEARTTRIINKTTIVHRHTVAVAVPQVQSYVAPTAVYAEPSVSVYVGVGRTGAQRRHAEKAAKHALRAAYWATRS